MYVMGPLLALSFILGALFMGAVLTGGIKEEFRTGYCVLGGKAYRITELKG